MKTNKFLTGRYCKAQMFFAVCLSFLAFMITSVSHGATFYVDVNSENPEAPYDTLETATTTIQVAIDYSQQPGDIILVAPGTYDKGGTLNTPPDLWNNDSITNRVFINKAIIVKAISDDPAETIIKGEPDMQTGIADCGEYAVRAVQIGSGAQLIGFTITEGYTRKNDFSSGSGGGVYAEHDSIISNCVIVANQAQSGGGIYEGHVYNCEINNNKSLKNGGGVRLSIVRNSTISENTSDAGGAGGQGGQYFHCIIADNVAASGGGGLLQAALAEDCRILRNKAGGAGAGVHSVTTVRRCLIEDNDATMSNNIGGGSTNSDLFECIVRGNKAGYTAGATGGTLVNCLIYNNVAMYHASGVASATLIKNCTIVNNTGGNAGLRGGGTIQNSIVWGNTPQNFDGAYTLEYCCFDDDGSGSLIWNWDDSINEDPMFLDPYTNFRLPKTSPCVDAGNNLTWTAEDLDLDGNPRVSRPDGRVDMGAYEFQFPPTGIIFTGH
ncbi:MAG: hypothetical protein GX811_11135 [Lentisphaerae bacterium]|nr:hypothetical protein [Lentisphaerota bacterium]